MLSFKPSYKLRNLEVVKFIHSNDMQNEKPIPKVKFKENEDVLYLR